MDGSDFSEGVYPLDPLSKLTGRLLVVLMAVLMTIAIVYIFITRETSQWDFQAYYWAAHVDNQGGDPYDHDAIKQAAGTEKVHAFLYPPITLPFFGLLADFPYETAASLWLILKVVLLVLLLYVWRKHFMKNDPAWMAYLFMMLALGAPIIFDLRAGNASIIEQTLLWSGFYFLKEKRPGPFCALVLAASIFKWTPMAFLLLLPLVRIEKRWFYLGVSAGTFLLTLLANYLPNPARFIHFLAAAVRLDERGFDSNPTILALFKDGARWLDRFAFPEVVTAWLPIILYVAVVAMVLILTARRFNLKRIRERTDEIIILIFMASLVYALIVPRFKTYSFILVVPAAFYIIRNIHRDYTVLLLFIILIVVGIPTLPGLQYFELLRLYFPTFAVYGLWSLWLLSLKQNGRPDRLTAPPIDSDM